MATATYLVGVVLERRKVASPWIDHVWLPVAVLPAAPDLAPLTWLGATDTGERFFAGGFEMDLHRTDTATYRDNLASGAPRIWVAARPPGNDGPPAVVGVTPDPAEGEALTEAGNDIVEAVPMPPEIEAVLIRFIADHHVERPFVKRKRDRWAGPEEDE
ncbi:DUF3305 domain-containing protein [Limobrevibacterium gyesilva]|uniref:DUF3305 domain-containing protein n=1 Tax=Limobrevibacterium gyesilva TaxID=2991712 RepID=A0AA41YJ72_9PROT|nr:DUF3305 domain-containing protein [Limobrevibacterium gyesilva]MCW3474159.1 DUF3305 domain-containing protein [Limobrevibacterium gyesilva]